MASTARSPSLPESGGAAQLRHRARGALLGPAVGDALASASMPYRTEIEERYAS
ncbi:hypothetical protein ACLGIH_25780 [Streptomyces sp. HMX87]|uniref:hypothetical protein n=1 Tax=Streptomyces sp. HMX87 TaxID=3390849 RepID=UPI003A898F2F